VMGPSNCGQNGQVWHTPCWDKVKAESLPADQPPKLARLEALPRFDWFSHGMDKCQDGSFIRRDDALIEVHGVVADELAAAHQRAESLIDEADATARRHAADRQADQKRIAEFTAHLEAQDEAQIANRARIAELDAQLAEALPTIAKCKEAIDLAKTAGEAQAKHVAELEAQLAEAKSSAGKRERLTADELRSVVDMWTQRHATAMAGDHEWAKMNLSYDVADAQYAKDGGK
jgi:hypothetical protein